jgi:protein O-mannosyl-transferase
MRSLSRHPDVWFALGVALLLVTAAFLYMPGLHGPFMFDDFANLPTLGAQGPIDNAPALLRYLVSGAADPTGRPISTASFLLEARDWPAPPYPFKRDNLILHLLNGGLLALVLRELGKALRIEERRSLAAAWLGAAAWLLHPMFVSTVLYVVQREAMLPATFCLLAMLTWLRARATVVDGGPARIAVTLGVWLLFAAAALSKPNGLLCPALILCTQAVLPSPVDDHERRARRWTLWLTIPGTMLVAGLLLAISVREILHGVNAVRGWSAGQRLMTEPAIIIEYLAQLALVRSSPSSVFHDQYQAAASLFTPWFTLPAILACTSLAIVAWVRRHRSPALSLAVLFFFVGHLIESSAIPLELYFEHRNYLPAMLLFWPLGLALTAPPARKAGGILAVAVLLALITLTRSNVVLWGNPARQATYWASVQPDSPRAQTYAAQIEATAGKLPVAVSRIDAAARQFPREPQVAFALADLHCSVGALAPSDAALVATALHDATRDPGALLSQWMSHAIEVAHQRTCAGLDLGTTRQWIAAASANPRIYVLAGRRQDLAHLSGLVELASGDTGAAASDFRRALLEEPKPQVALNEAALLGAAGEPSLGLAHLEYFDALPKSAAPSIGTGMAWIRFRIDGNQGYWVNEMNSLRAKLARHAQPAPQ